MDMREHCLSDGETIFFNENRSFQDKAMEKWNKNTEDVTGSLFVRFVGLKEDDKEGVDTVALDLLLKGVTIK